jgi:hypothetical protein
MRLLAYTAFVCLLALGASSVASADTQVGTQDPNAAVTVSLRSSGMDPNVANVGDTVRAFVSVKTSNFFTLSFVRVFVIGDWAGTKVGVNKEKLLKLKPGKTWDWDAKFKVRQRTPLGAYSLTVLAITPDIIDSSIATATITAVGTGADVGDDSREREENESGDDD